VAHPIAPTPVGSTISLYLADGKPAGIRTVKKDNWSGIGLDCSRSDLPRAKKREEFDGPGVYLLVGDEDEEIGLPAIYVGETDELRERLPTQAAKQDFWIRLVIFASKDEGINKAHVKHLEARLYEIGTAAKRSHLQNKTPPGLPNLNASDKDVAERFLAEMLVVLPVIGITAFELPDSTAAAPGVPSLQLQGAGAVGHGRETGQGFNVRAGSQARLDEVESIHEWTHKLRLELQEKGVLKPENDALIFTQDYVFKSPSAAAAVLLGRSANGRTEWKTAEGKTLKQVQEEALVPAPESSSAVGE
jgi:hypothetical protein